jgi:pilus assembly protein CpaF
LADSLKDAYEFTLVISEKGGAERKQAFRGAEVTIGRVSGNDIVLGKGNVSKRHARLLFREGRLIVTDLNSTNGTFVNRRRIVQATILRPQDRLFIGDYVLRVEPSLGSEVHGVDTTDRLSAPPLANATTKFTVEGEAAARVTLVPGEHGLETRRGSSGPPPRRSETVEPSARSHDGGAQRIAVARVVRAVLAARGEPPLEAAEADTKTYSDDVAAIVDQLLVDGEIPVGTTGEAVHDVAALELLDLGPLATLLDDVGIVAVSGSRPDDLVEVRDGRLQACALSFSCPEALALALKRMLRRAQLAEAGTESGIWNGRFERNGTWWTASIARDAQAWIFSIERAPLEPVTLDELVRRGCLSRAMASFLGLALQARLNVVVTSALGNDAHLVASALLQSVGRERILRLAEDTESLPNYGSAFRLPADPEARKRALILALSLPLVRLLFTVDRGPVASALLDLGSARASTFLALGSTARLSQLIRTLPAQLARGLSDVSPELASAWVETSFDVGIEVTRLADGRLRVTRIAEIHAGLELEDVFTFVATRVLPGGTLEGNFAPTSGVPRVLAAFQNAGLRIDPALFSRGSDPGEAGR